MPVKKIEFTNLKGKTGTCELFTNTKLRGANGTGKTLIRDAIAFTFCGTDSYGTRNPTHLISIDQDNLKITIDTGKAVFSRTLTRKGSSTIKLEVAGVATTYNQTQLEDKIGKTDTFLSVLIPGYFFTLSEAKQQEVLSDVLPPVNRIELIKEVSGLDISEDEQKKYGLHRRYDLIASAVSTDRRSYENAINQKNGSIAAYKKIVKPEPVGVNCYAQQVSEMDNLKQLHNKYEDQLRSVRSIELHNSNITEANNLIKKRLSDIDIEIDHNSKLLQDLSLLKPEETDAEFNEKIKSLSSGLKREPPEPTLQNLITNDNCHTCGQVVGERHRDSVRAQNEKIKTEYLKTLEEIKMHNESITNTVNDFKLSRNAVIKKYQDAVNFNRDVKAKIQALENEKANTKEQVVLQLPVLVEKPEHYDLVKHLELKELSKKHEHLIGAYDLNIKMYNNAQNDIQKLECELLDNQQTLDRLLKLENTLKEIPGLELKKQAGLFNTDTLVFDGKNVFFNNVIYNMLSAGEKIAVSFYFSRTISSLWHKSHKIIFLDDADLLSTETYEKVSPKLPAHEEFQTIMAYVTNDTEVKVSEN